MKVLGFLGCIYLPIISSFFALFFSLLPVCFLSPLQPFETQLLVFFEEMLPANCYLWGTSNYERKLESFLNDVRQTSRAWTRSTFKETAPTGD